MSWAILGQMECGQVRGVYDARGRPQHGPLDLFEDGRCRVRWDVLGSVTASPA